MERHSDRIAFRAVRSSIESHTGSKEWPEGRQGSGTLFGPCLSVKQNEWLVGGECTRFGGHIFRGYVAHETLHPANSGWHFFRSQGGVVLGLAVHIVDRMAHLERCASKLPQTTR